MASQSRICPDCESSESVSRRDFIRTTGVAAAAIASGLPNLCSADASTTSTPETVVKTLYESLSDQQKKTICFDWDYISPERKKLRTFIANNWNITKPNIKSKFYTPDQQAMVRSIFEGIIQPDWHERIDKQLEDDAGGFGHEQSIAIFGKPGEKFE